MSPKMNKLPPFLAKKLDEAIIKAAQKNDTEFQAALLQDKLRKAELNRQELQCQKTIKLVQHRDRIEGTQTRLAIRDATRAENYDQIYTAKQSLALIQAQAEKDRVVQQAQAMGSLKICENQIRKANIETFNHAKWEQFTNERFAEKIEAVELKKKAVVEKNMKRNYEILKNVHRVRFSRIIEHQKKAKSYQTRQAQAKVRREAFLQARINKAKSLYSLERYVKEIPIENATQQLESLKITKIEECKTEESESPSQDSKMNIDSESANTASVQTDTNEDFFKNRKSAVAKKNSVKWEISRKAGSKNDPQTDSDNETNWEKI